MSALYGCVGINSKAGDELNGIKKMIDAKQPAEEGSSSQTPNERAVERELRWLDLALRRANLDLEPESIPKKYLGMTEKMLIEYKLGKPNGGSVDSETWEWRLASNDSDKIFQRKMEKRVLTYYRNEPGKIGLAAKRLFLPGTRVKRTTLQFTIVEGIVVGIVFDNMRKKWMWEMPLIMPVAAKAAVIMKGF
ncbi:MAG: hypothetical protein AAB926_01910 [Patescibacteria group bacterium]